MARASQSKQVASLLFLQSCGSMRRISRKGARCWLPRRIGKITKFITPAKFSNCLIAEDRNIPNAPNIKPEKINAGRIVKYPDGGGIISQKEAINRKAYTCSIETKTPARSLEINKNHLGIGLTNIVFILPISLS